MSLQVIAEEYAFVLDSCFPRNQRAVRLQALSDGSVIVGDWSDEGDLFDSGSELRVSPGNVNAFRKVFARADAASPAVPS